MFEERKLGNFVLTKHSGSLQIDKMIEYRRRAQLNLKLVDCRFNELCFNFRIFCYKSDSLEHLYLEGLKYYHKKDWIAANSRMDNLLKYSKDFLPALNIKKTINSNNNLCPPNWSSYELIDLEGED